MSEIPSFPDLPKLELPDHLKAENIGLLEICVWHFEEGFRPYAIRRVKNIPRDEHKIVAIFSRGIEEGSKEKDDLCIIEASFDQEDFDRLKDIFIYYQKLNGI